MKSSLLIIITLATILTAGIFANTIFALPTPGDIPDLGVKSPLTNESITGLSGIIVDVFQWIYTIFFIIAGIMLLFAAFTYLTSGGDPEKVGSAKNQIIYAVVAIVVALLAVSINVIVDTFIRQGA